MGDDTRDKKPVIESSVGYPADSDETRRVSTIRRPRRMGVPRRPKREADAIGEPLEDKKLTEQQSKDLDDWQSFVRPYLGGSTREGLFERVVSGLNLGKPFLLPSLFGEEDRVYKPPLIVRSGPRSIEDDIEAMIFGPLGDGANDDGA